MICLTQSSTEYCSLPPEHSVLPQRRRNRLASNASKQVNDIRGSKRAGFEACGVESWSYVSSISSGAAGCSYPSSILPSSGCGGARSG